MKHKRHGSGNICLSARGTAIVTGDAACVTTCLLTIFLLVATMSVGHCEVESLGPNKQRICATEQVCSDDRLDSEHRDCDGLRRDSWYFLGYQLGVIGVLYVMPEGVSGWGEEQKSGYSISHWWDNVRHPAMDSDDDYINYVLHPYWGAAYFVRARERGYNSREAFWYAAFLSSAYEFGAEALFEEPSIQDLIVTPVFGLLAGRYFMRVRDDIRDRSWSRGYRTTGEKWVWVLTDPLGAMNRRVDRLFGRRAELHVQPFYRLDRRFGNSAVDTSGWKIDRVVGLEFQLRW